MPIKTLIPEALGTFVLQPGSPGAPGGPGGAAAPNAGAGWELGVYSAASGYGTLLTMVPQRLWNSFTFSKLLNDQGSGTVVLHMDDPWWTTTSLVGGLAPHFILDEEHCWAVFQDGIRRFDFMGETITEQLIDQSETRLVTVTGPGSIVTLSWAMAAPPGFPSTIVYKTDALSDAFSEVNTSGQYVVDYGLWNASGNTSSISINPAGSAQLTATTGGTTLGSTEWDFTNTLFSAQVTPIVSPDLNNISLNGSQLTQMYIADTSGSGYYVMIGMSGTSLYAQYRGPDGTFTQVIATAAQYAAGMSATYQYAYWQISEVNGTFYFWVSPDGQTWVKVWTKSRDWDSSRSGVYFSSLYSGTTTEFATITAINSDVVTSSLGGATYLDLPIIDIYLQTLAAAQQRGTIPFVVTAATAASDSFGNAWTDSNSVQIQNGTDLYALLQGHTQMVDADFIMEPGFRLVIGLPSATTPNDAQVTLGYDRSSAVAFFDSGSKGMEQRQRQRNQIQNLIAVINSDSLTVTGSDPSSISTWGQREAWVQAAAQVTASDLNTVASAASQQYADEILSWTLQITPNQAKRTVFKDFAVGDWVGLELPDFSAVDAVRVVGITISVDQDGNETHELVLESYVAWLEQRLQYIATKMGGGYISANGTTAVADNAQGSTLQAPTVFSIGLSSLGVPTSTGGAPLVYNPVTGQWVPAGSTDPTTGSEVPLTLAGRTGQSTLSTFGLTVGTPNSQAALNSNPQFAGGSLAGWQASNATIASVTPSAGLPSQQYAAQITPSGSSAALIETSLPLIPVQAGQGYTLYAYAFLPTQSNMGITTQIAWYDIHSNLLRTDNVSTAIPASQWVQLAYQDQAPGPAYDTQVQSSSPSAWWKLTDASGSASAADSSGYGHAGTATSVTFAQTFTPVPGNTCASFNGTSSGILTTFNPAGATQLTAEAWVNLNSNTQTGSPRIIANSHTDADFGGFQLVLSGTTVNVGLGNGTTATTVASASGAIPSTGWTHVAATWDGTSVLLFVNGVQVAASTFTGPLGPGHASGTSIGYNATYNGDYVKGLIGEAAVYPVALPPAVIALHALNLTVPGAGAGAAYAAIGAGITSGSSGNPGQIANLELVQGLATSTGASSTTVTQTGTTVTDSGGNTRVVAGQQPDGTVTTNYYNGPPPLAPDPPSVTGTMLGLTVAWDGLLGGVSFGSGSAPLSDFFHVQVHVSTTNGFTPSSATLYATMIKSGTVVINQLLGGTAYYVVLVAVNESNVSSAPSSQVSATAQSVASNIPNGSITEIMLATGVGGVDVTIGSTAPSSPRTGDLWYNATQNYELEQWNGTSWQAYQFGTNAIAAGSVTAALIAANTITAAQIASGTITATQIAAATITATQIASNTILAANLAADIIVAGIVNGTIITGADVIADGPNGGFFGYSGTPALGNLVFSAAPSPGTDPSGNAYPAGMQIGQNGGSQILANPFLNSTFNITNVISGIVEAAFAQSTTDTNESIASIIGTVLLGSGTATKMSTVLSSPMDAQSAVIVLEGQNDAGTDTSVITIGTATTPDDETLVFSPIMTITPYAMVMYSGGGTTTVVTKTSGSGTIPIPSGVTTALGEAWGPAGGGGGSSSPAPGEWPGGGGGAGSYAAEPNLAVTSGGTVSYSVGSGGSGGVAGANGANGSGATTLTGSSVTVTGNAGTGGGHGTTSGGGLGGSAGTGGAASSNTVANAGGNGATGGNGLEYWGGGGGSSAGPGAAGNAGQTGSNQPSGYGGTAVAGGGMGGNGGAGNDAGAGSPGSAGQAPGGGGGGAGGGTSSTKSGAAGANGKVRLTYTTGNPPIGFSINFGSSFTDQFGNTVPAGIMSTLTVTPSEPGSSPAVPETWHNITMDSGWTAVSGFDAPRYRLTADGNLQLSGAAALSASRTTSANLNSSNPLPSAYRPVNTHHYRSWDDSATDPRFAVQIANTGIIEGIANSSTPGQIIEIDGIIPLT